MSDEQEVEVEVKPKKFRAATSKPPAPEGTVTEPKEKKPRAARGSAKFSMDAKIKLLVDKNPKLASSKSYLRFEEYVDGMTCKEALEKGILLADLYYDSEHRFIEIEGYEAPALVKKERTKKEPTKEPEQAAA